MNLISAFMRLYMYELEVYLNNHKDEISNVSFQSDEANTDRPLKEYLKNKIETTFNCIPLNSLISSVEYAIENNVNIYNLEQLKNVYIQRVLLPDEITEQIKDILKSTKNAVYTNPDMCFELKHNNTTYYETVELKSTKQDSIPGSSIQQILPLEWVVFIKHTNTKIEITTGQYIHAINSKMQFPDRSPRPQVSFQEMRKWNLGNRILNGSTLYYKTDADEDIKYDLIKDWQGVLVDRWMDMLFNSEYIKGNEPWFNNNMRKFILVFLEKYDSLSETEKQKFKNKIQSLIVGR